MTLIDACQILNARLRCSELDNGLNSNCNNHLCSDCFYNYASGNKREYKEALKTIIDYFKESGVYDGRIF